MAAMPINETPEIKYREEKGRKGDLRASLEKL